MPQNNDLKPVSLPMDLRFDEEPTTEFKNSLDALRIEAVDYPDRERMRRAAYLMINATWADNPPDENFWNDVTDEDLSDALEDLFSFKALPTAMEQFGFTFLFAGIDLQTVTHLIRHRTGSFAAQCTGDRFLHHEPCLVPPSVLNSPEFLERWKEHVESAKKLYADMVDTRQISMMDARCILPKCLETFYYARFNIKDLFGFIKQRQDKQIQPEVDNLMAAYVAREILKVFPEAHVAINLETPAWHYIKNLRSGTGTNLYWPDSDSDDHVEYHPEDTIYQGVRDDIRGTGDGNDVTVFRDKWNEVLGEIEDLVTDYKETRG